jgi:hypothetical protein
VALLVHRARRQLLVVEGLRDRLRLPSVLDPFVEPALLPGGRGVGEREVAVLGGLRLGREQALGAVLPARCHRRLEVMRVLGGEPERDESGPRAIALRQVRCVRALVDVEELVDAPRPPGGVRELLEIAAREAALVVGCVVGVVTLLPLASVHRPARLLDRAHRTHCGPRGREYDKPNCPGSPISS